MVKRIDSYSVFVLVVCLVTSIIIGFSVLQSGLGLSPDSVMYLSIANSLTDGKGLIGYNGSFIAGFPPGFPLFIALLKNLFGNNLLSVLLVCNLLINSISIWLGSRLIKEITKVTLYKRLGVLFLGFNFALMYNVTMLWSEPLFILFILLLVTALDRYYRVKEGYISLLVISLIIGVATVIRYAGVVLIPAVLATILIKEYKISIRKSLLKGGIVSSLSILPLVLVFAINYNFTGTLTGAREGAESSFISSGGGVIVALVGIIIPVFPLLFKGSLASIIPLPLLSVSENSDKKMEGKGSISDSATILFSIFFATMYILLIWVTAGVTLIDKPDHRLISPVVSSILFLMIWALDRRTIISASKPVYRGITAVFIIVVAVNVFSSIGYLGKVYRNGIQGYSNRVWIESDLAKYYKNNIVKYNCCIMSNEPEILYLQSKQTVLNSFSKKELSNNYKQVKSEIGQNGLYFFYFIKSKRNYLANPEELKPFFLVEKTYSTFDGDVYLIKNK